MSLGRTNGTLAGFGGGPSGSDKVARVAGSGVGPRWARARVARPRTTPALRTTLRSVCMAGLLAPRKRARLINTREGRRPDSGITSHRFATGIDLEGV